jgi:uncharacterized protein
VDVTDSLSSTTRRWLLAWARGSIATHLGATTHEGAGVPTDAEAPGGCFVSLHTKSGELRGCIGTFTSDGPLWHAVRDMAIAAASRDPRFPSLTRAELDGCHIEISVLSPLRTASAAEIEVGRHGICIERGYQRGVLLPQVAVEYGWDRDTFLEHTCMKAGLPREAWREPGTKIEIFSAEIFGDIGHG